ncbi:MAG TPA: hypothetical protein VIW64_07930 [Pyrinomonadaceae bacterium]|jgi:hypothetical protein
MHLFKSREPNLVHYATAVTFNRLPIFRNDRACSLLMQALALTREKELHYIHMNPVRAGLCDHPGKWRWSSYPAYLPQELGAVPIEVDQRWLWTKKELTLGHGQADKSAF